MGLEKGIIKATTAATTAFEYKPRELTQGVSEVATSFVNEDAFISTDFKISDLVAQQAGISALADEAHQDKVNAVVLEKLKEVQEKAYQEGYQLGLTEGSEKAFQEGKSDLVDRMRSIESILKSIENLKKNLLIDNEANLIQLLFLVAKKMALRDLEENRDAVKQILSDILGEMQKDEQLIVRLNAEDLLFIEGLQEKSKEKIESLERVKFIVEDSIKPGGCMIESEYGTVDATIEERVERTWATLQSRIPHRNPGNKE
ncbi:MAG: FliH/SctL family protein [Pseudobdellovibrionaceae bacterium]